MSADHYRLQVRPVHNHHVYVAKIRFHPPSADQNITLGATWVYLNLQDCRRLNGQLGAILGPDTKEEATP